MERLARSDSLLGREVQSSGSRRLRCPEQTPPDASWVDGFWGAGLRGAALVEAAASGGGGGEGQLEP